MADLPVPDPKEAPTPDPSTKTSSAVTVEEPPLGAMVLPPPRSNPEPVIENPFTIDQMKPDTPTPTDLVVSPVVASRPSEDRASTEGTRRV